MPRNVVNPFVQSFTYDFNKDRVALVTRGTVGTFELGIQIPQNALFFLFSLFCTTTVTSAGLATISIGTVTTNGLLYNARPFSAFTSGLSPVQSLPMVRMDGTLNLTMTIGTAALTAGVFNGYVHYYFPG